jgi:hypothetical protein
MATKPNNNITRGYYSPNAKIQEGYYRGPTSTVVTIIKNSLANVTNFASRSRSLNRAKFAQALATVTAATTKTFNRVKQSLSTTVSLSIAAKNIGLSKLAKVIQTMFEGVVISFEKLIQQNYYPTYWYKMNESSGAIVNYGSTGTANNLGTLRNITYRQSSPVKSNGGYALSFDGSSSYAELVTPNPIPPGAGGSTPYFTFGAWVNFASTNTGYIASWGNPQSGSRQGFVLRYNNATTALEFLWGDGFRAKTLSFTAFTPILNSWYYFLVTMDTVSGYVYLYVVNKNDGSTTSAFPYGVAFAGGNFNSYIYWGTNPSLFIGAQNASTNFFQGSMSEVTISFSSSSSPIIASTANVELSLPTQPYIAALYNNAGTGNGPTSVQANFARVRKSLATATNSVFVAKIFNGVRTSLANGINLAINTKSVSFIRNVLANVINSVLLKKSNKLIRYSSTNLIQLVSAKRRLTAIRKSIVTTTNVINNVKVFKAIRKSTANAIILAINIKKIRRIRTALVNATGYILPKRIDHFFRYGTARLAQLAFIKRRFALIRSARSIVSNLSIARSLRSKIRKAIVSAIPSASIFKNKVQHRKSGPIQIVAATVTKTKGKHRSAAVTVTYEIASSKGRTFFRKAIATAVGLYKYSLRRVANIRAKENAVVQPVNQINSYVVTNNNLDDVGTYSASVDNPGQTYAEPDDAAAGNFNISTDNPAITYTEPDFPSGEDVVPT